MAKRLQVILQDFDHRDIQRAARSRRMSLAEWVRQALALARQREPAGGVGKKLEVIRAAVRCDFPTGDIDRMPGAGQVAGYRADRCDNTPNPRQRSTDL
jgi:hypothetical protein